MIILLPHLLLPLISAAQVADDFTDGDFLQDPPWSGDTAQFEVNSSGQLHLKSAGTDTSYLSTPSSVAMNTEWRFWVKQSFNSSANNFGRVYLISDQADLKSPLNGYFIQTGDASDSISLCRQSGLSFEKVIRGSLAYTGNSVNTLRIKAVRDNSGLWSLYSDPTGGTDFQAEGSAFDSQFSNAVAMGVFCKYTSSNATKFYFDDFYAGPILVDTIPPSLLGVEAISATRLDLKFSESVDRISAANPANYQVSNSIGHPSLCLRDSLDHTLVTLEFQSPLTPGLFYEMTVANIRDLNQNMMVSQVVPFSYHNIRAYDLVINEIMADPDPPTGLPAHEYVEIYNRTDYPVNLENWTFTSGASKKTLPAAIAEPHGYIILTSPAGETALSCYGKVLALSGFSLTNTGQTLILSDTLGQVISTISYTDGWYRDPAKKNGGWSLEQVDPMNPCGGEENWQASAIPQGGTPGSQNSIYAPNPDNQLPLISHVSVLSECKLKVCFSESIDSTTLGNPSQYSADGQAGAPVAVTLVPPAYCEVILTFDQAFQPEHIYTLTVTDTIRDCAGNTAVHLCSSFALYPAKAFDVQINELMADPDPCVYLPDAEYLELFNRSGFPVDLRNWVLQQGSSRWIFPPAEIVADSFLLVASPANVFLLSSYGPVVGLEGWSLANNGECLVLHDSSLHVISCVDYTERWYHDHNKSGGGWSLEQADPANPCSGESNWTASCDPSGGTPGRRNSVFQSNPDESAPVLQRVEVLDFSTVRAWFNEPLDSLALADPDRFLIDHDIGIPVRALPDPPDYRSVGLFLGNNLQDTAVYHLTLTGIIKDCAGNQAGSGQTARFAIPRLPGPWDVVINELLSNPREEGVDFVELYNRSGKVYDLRDMKLSSWDEAASALINVCDITTSGFLMFPGDYIVLTPDPGIVMQQYHATDAGNFIGMDEFPAYNNDEGRVVLTDRSLRILDQFSYTADMHYPLLTSTEGVSLERLSYDRPSDEKSNWHSASAPSGFGTPGRRNSQFTEAISFDGEITMNPEIFSPDNDGYYDVQNIEYKFGLPGYLATVAIFDQRGRLVRNLARNELLGTSGTWSWDGTDETNHRLPRGIYVAYIQLIDLQGIARHVKKAVLMGGK